MVDMSLSLPTDQLFKIGSWLFLCIDADYYSASGKANICANRQAQLHHLCHVIQNDMFIIIILLLTSFVFFTLLFQFCTNFIGCLSCKSVQFPCNFFIMMWLLLQMLCLVIGSFIFWVQVSLCQSVEPQ